SKTSSYIPSFSSSFIDFPVLNVFAHNFACAGALIAIVVPLRIIWNSALPSLRFTNKFRENMATSECKSQLPMRFYGVFIVFLDTCSMHNDDIAVVELEVD